MSSSHPPFGSERARQVREALRSPPAGLSKPVAYLAAPIRFVAFWAAVALPFLYIPLLAGGLQGSEPVALATLLIANVAALLVGHGYPTDTE